MACGNHFAGHRMANKALSKGYWQPLMIEHMQAMARRYEACQKHKSMTNLLAEELPPMFAAWLFTQLGFDIIRLIKRDTNYKRFLQVTINSFTKWMEVKALASISAQVVRWFVWEDIICHFGIPHTIISDNDKQFDA